MMNQQTFLDDDDYRRKKINFWIVWTVGNALGTSAGWALGETIGRITSASFGVRIGLAIAALIFEATIWIPRAWIFRYYQELKPVRFLEEVVWIIMEGFMWIVTDIFTSTNVTYFTLGAVLSIMIGAMMSVVFSIMGLPKVQSRKGIKKKVTIWWALKMFAITFLGFIAADIIFSVIAATSMKISDTLQKLNPVVGWTLAGLVFGAGVGAITGFGYVNLISRRNEVLT